MKVLPFDISKETNSSFVFQEDKAPTFYPHFHKHPELQITSIIAGHGNAFIGEWTGAFKSGDAFIIGSSVPHVFKSELRPNEVSSDQDSHCHTIFLQESSLGPGFFDLPEIKHVKGIFSGSCAWQIQDSLTDRVSEHLIELKNSRGAKRLSELLFLLDSLSDSQGLELLTTGAGSWAQSEHMSQRLALVLEYLGTNFKKSISLSEIASKASLTPSAFSRFFVKCTGKTFTTYLNDLRITYSCNQLIHSDLDVLSICFQSGFNNVSNFNRRFKNRKGITPKEYRASYSTL